MALSPQATVIVHRDARLVFASTYFCDLVGVRIETVAGKSLLDFVAPEDKDKTVGMCKTSEPSSCRVRLIRIDGTEVSARIEIDSKYNGTSVVAKISAA